MSGVYTTAQKRATEKYLKTLANISIRVKREEYEKYKNFAKDHGMSLREFVLSSMEEKIENETK